MKRNVIALGTKTMPCPRWSAGKTGLRTSWVPQVSWMQSMWAIHCEHRTASAGLPVQTTRQCFFCKSNVSCTRKEQKGESSNVVLAHIKTKTEQANAQDAQQQPPGWASQGSWKGKGKWMERRYFSFLERAAGGSVCQSKRQHAQAVVKAQSSKKFCLEQAFWIIWRH